MFSGDFSHLFVRNVAKNVHFKLFTPDAALEVISKYSGSLVNFGLYNSLTE
jgi:hypothetical protein